MEGDESGAVLGDGSGTLVDKQDSDAVSVIFENVFKALDLEDLSDLTKYIPNFPIDIDDTQDQEVQDDEGQASPAGPIYNFIQTERNPEYDLPPALASTIKQFIDEYPWGISLTEFRRQFQAKTGFFPQFSDYDYFWPSPLVCFLENEPNLFHIWQEPNIFSRYDHTPEYFLFPCSSKTMIPDLKTIFELIWSFMLVSTAHIRPPWSAFELWAEVDEKFQLSKQNVLKNWGLDMAGFVKTCLIMCRPQNYELEVRSYRSGKVLIFPTNRSPHFKRLLPLPDEEPKHPCSLPIVPRYHVEIGTQIDSIAELIKPNEVHEVTRISWARYPDCFGAGKLSYRHGFKLIEDAIERQFGKYDDEHPIDPTTTLPPGTYVMIWQEERSFWARGVLHSKISNTHYSIFLIDWAKFRIVSFEHIRFMPKQFELYPAVGTLCRFVENEDLVMKYGENMLFSDFYSSRLKESEFKSPQYFAFKFLKKSNIEKNIVIWDVEVMGMIIGPDKDEKYSTGKYFVNYLPLELHSHIFDPAPVKFVEITGQNQTVEQVKRLFEAFTRTYPPRSQNWNTWSHTYPLFQEYIDFLERGDNVETLKDKWKLLNLFPKHEPIDFS